MQQQTESPRPLSDQDQAITLEPDKSNTYKIGILPVEKHGVSHGPGGEIHINSTNKKSRGS